MNMIRSDCIMCKAVRRTSLRLTNEPLASWPPNVKDNVCRNGIQNIFYTVDVDLYNERIG